jgi:hypothetical protein
MGFSMEAVGNGRGILFAGRGELNARAIIDAKRGLLADADRVRRLTFAIVSLLEVTNFNITVAEIRELAGVDEQIATLAPRVSVAIVAPSDHDFGVARMWESIVDIPGWLTMVFRALPEAQAWLRDTIAMQARLPDAGGTQSAPPG